MFTWGGRSEFRYEGNIQTGTALHYGRGWVTRVDAAQYEAMLNHFRGQTISVRATRGSPQLGTLEHWLRGHVSGRTIASYVAPVLVNEGVADRVGNMLQFKA